MLLWLIQATFRYEQQSKQRLANTKNKNYDTHFSQKNNKYIKICRL